MTVPPTVEALIELSRSGRHAASDHLETAALVGVATVGCRRCGGGLAGAVATSNVAEGARIAAALDPDLVVFDGSGAAFPPIATDRTVVVVGAHQDPAVATGYLNAYRLRVADLVVVTMAEREVATGACARAGRRDRSTGRAGGRNNAPPAAAGRRSRPDGRVLLGGAARRARAASESISRTRSAPRSSTSPGSLANRAALRSELETVSADVYLVELKAAAIDVVAEAALAKGAQIVLAANDVVAVPGEPDLDEQLLGMAKFQT